MKAFIASLLFLALLGIRVPASFAQQDQSYQKLAQEMESLRTQLSAVQSQLQTVENVEKIELTAKLAEAQAKLTDANAKLMNTQFGKFERELKNSYDDWLQTWTLVFLTVVGVSVAILFGVSRAYWYWLSSKTEKLIGDGVEEKINGFMEAIDQVNILENKVKVLDKEHAAEMLGRFIGYPFTGEDAPGQIKELKVEALLDVLRDETRHPDIKVRAVQVLTGRQSPRLVSPVLELLNSTLDSHQDKELSLPIAGHLSVLVNLLGYICTQETYEGLKEYLNRLLLRENIELKDLLLTETISSIARVNRKLNKEDWVSILKPSFSNLGDEPETIKGILNRLSDEMPGVDDFENYLLELLENHDPEFVIDWREQIANANTEPEETS